MELKVSWVGYAATIPKVTLKVCQASLKISKHTLRIFERSMYSPKNVTCKSTTDVYFLTKIS